MNHLVFERAGKIVAVACGGALLIECFREAAQLSLQYRVTVEFVFNGNEYQVLYEDLINCIKDTRKPGQGDASNVPH